MATDTQALSMRPLLRDDLRIPMEQQVSAYLGRAWQVQQAEDKCAEASHPAAILADESYAVFVKLGTGELALDQLTQELAGLRLLTVRGGVRTPTAIGIVQVAESALLILEAVQVVVREPIHWRQIGQTLAQLHQTQGESFGLATHCYWGSLYQDNRPLADWSDFFWQRRIAPRLRAAVDAGRLPLAFVPQVEQVGNRLAALCGPPVQPTLLHGDAHQNNFLSTAQGPVLIDPSVYYGHPEIDLAHVDFFAPTPVALWEGYQAFAPIDPGFAQRRDLWRLPTWLAMVEVDGPQHLDTLRAILERYQ